MTEMERKLVETATIYNLRLILKNGSKTEYTLEELYDLLDSIVMAKEQEN